MSTNYFTENERSCPCCGIDGVKPDFLAKLNLARQVSDIPYRINSMFRCSKHNTKVGGVIDSSHVKGLGVDIATGNSIIRFKVIRGLYLAGFKRIIPHEKKKFIHVDDDPAKPKEVFILDPN